MSPANSELLWIRARRAHVKLVDRFLAHPEVCLIDIGRDPGQNPADRGQSQERIVLRVHLRRPVEKKVLCLPREVDGIPVCMMIRDYKI